MIEKIQLTALVISITAWAVVTVLKEEKLPDWGKVAILGTFTISVVTGFVTTLIKIWQ